MSKSRRKRERAMSRKRREAVRSIERARQQPPQPRCTAPVVGPPAPKDPASAELRARARALGLSVRPDAGADLVRRRLDEFDLVSAYAGDVWRARVGPGGPPPPVEAADWRACVVSLLDDGHLAARIMRWQRARKETGPSPGGADQRRVARQLRQRFGDAMPRPRVRGWLGWLSRRR